MTRTRKPKPPMEVTPQMPGTIWTLEIPGFHPTPINQLMGNWKKAARLKRHDHDIVCMAATAYGMTPAQGKRHVNLTLVYGAGERATDPDASFKSLLDSLVACMVLKNDSHQWVSWDQPIVLRGPDRRCFITIREV